FLDLVGSRKDLRRFRELIEAASNNNSKTKNWPIGKFIEYAKEIDNVNPGFFPYKIIRAIDNHPKVNMPVSFVEGKPNYTNLDPRIVICILEKNTVILKTKEIIFESTND